MSSKIENNINTQQIGDVLKKAYFTYAKTVIEDRAVPHVNDGCKPVQRRILYSMYENQIVFENKPRKSANIVGRVLGDYHPHGDTAVYFTMVRMAQEWSYRNTLIQGQGNFGSIDGDPPAAMRYTEAKTTKYASELFHDLDVINMIPNYDGTNTEPIFLPARVPNLFINGTQGIAVGISTSIPPHNLIEICTALKYYLYNENISTQELMQYVQGPDFPTGGIISDYNAIYQAYETGESSLTIRARYIFEGNNIVFTDIPFTTSKSNIMKSLIQNIKDGRIKSTGAYDDSDKEGVRIVIKCRTDISKEFVLEQIYAHTPLRIRFRCCFFAMNEENKPEIYTLKSYLKTFLKFRNNIIVARTIADMEKYKKKIHILIGLYIAHENLDEIINIIRSQNNTNTLKEILQTKAWKCEKLEKFLSVLNLSMNNHVLSNDQIKQILDMKLSNLTRLEQGKIEEELLTLRKNVEKSNYVLNTPEERNKIIEQELDMLIKTYGTPRTSEIAKEYKVLTQKDLVEPEEVLIVLDEKKYIKRVKISNYKLQNRGGKGKSGNTSIACNIVAHTHSQILFFISSGKVYSLYCYELPEGDHTYKGRALINILQLQENEEVINFLVISDEQNKNADSYSILFVSNTGYVRRNALSQFISLRSNGKIYIEKELLQDTKIVSINIAHNNDYLVIATSLGQASIAQVNNYRLMNTRQSLGVIGCKLNKNDHVISAAICSSMNDYLLTITSNGYGKLSKLDEYRITNRGSKGVINLKLNKKTGIVIEILSIDINDEILLLSETGQTIKIPCNQIRITSRNAQGVTLCKIEDVLISASIC